MPSGISGGNGEPGDAENDISKGEHRAMQGFYETIAALLTILSSYFYILNRSSDISFQTSADRASQCRAFIDGFLAVVSPITFTVSVHMFQLRYRALTIW